MSPSESPGLTEPVANKLRGCPVLEQLNLLNGDSPDCNGIRLTALTDACAKVID